MTDPFTSWRDTAEGAAWGAVVGILGGLVLIGNTVTAEVGQVLWLTTVVAGALVISPVSGSFGVAAGACLPFFAAICGTLVWSGAARLGLSVGKAVLISRAPIPLAAFTERELAFRHGIFFLFVLCSSLPAVIGALLAWQGAVGVVGLFVSDAIPSVRGGIKIGRTLRLVTRVAACTGMLMLVAIS